MKRGFFPTFYSTTFFQAEFKNRIEPFNFMIIGIFLASDTRSLLQQKSGGQKRDGYLESNVIF